MRISDWSSDVCSSDLFHAEQCALERGEALAERAGPADAAAPRDEGTALADAGLANQHLGVEAELGDGVAGLGCAHVDGGEQGGGEGCLPRFAPRPPPELGKATGRESGGPSV